MALPIASYLQIPAKNVFCNTMSWQLDDNGEPIRLQVCAYSVFSAVGHEYLGEHFFIAWLQNLLMD